MKRYFTLYGNFVKNCFRRETMYRFNFFVNLLTVVLGYLANILFFTFVYDTGIESISGWSRYQVYCLLATIWIVDSIFGGVFFFNLIRIPVQVKKYELDGLFLKPVNPIFVIAMRQFNFGLFSGVFFGIAFLFYSIIKGGLSITFTGALFYFILIICAVVLLFSILFMMVTFSLRFVRIQGLIQMFWTMMDLGKNPHSIYPMPLKTISTFFIPAIVIYNFPTQVLTNANFFNSMNRGSTIVIALILTCLWLWVAVTYFRKSWKYYYC